MLHPSAVLGVRVTYNSQSCLLLSHHHQIIAKGKLNCSSTDHLKVGNGLLPPKRTYYTIGTPQSFILVNVTVFFPFRCS